MSMGNEFGNVLLTPDRLVRADGEGRMTVGGTVAKFVLFLAVMVGTAGWIMHEAAGRFEASGIDFAKIVSVPVEGGEEGETKTVYLTTNEAGQEIQGAVPEVDLGNIPTLMWAGLAAGFVFSLICIFVPKAIPVFGLLYAVCEGLALGGVSAYFEVMTSGIAMQAFAITVIVQLLTLALYVTGVLRATPFFVSGLLLVMGGIFVTYVADILFQSFTGSGFGFIHSTGWLGIGFSIFVCIIAALNFVIDYQTIDEGVDRGAPKHMEWYAAFAMLLTFVWLYLEILRLLAKLNSKNNSSMLWRFATTSPNSTKATEQIANTRAPLRDGFGPTTAT